MSIAAGFDKHRESIGNSIDAVLSKIAQDEAMKQLLQQTSRTNKKIKKNLTSFDDPVKDATWETDNNGIETQTLGNIGTNPGGNYNDAMRDSKLEVANFFNSQIANRNIPEDKLRLALSGLNATLGSFQRDPGEYKEVDPYKDIMNTNTGQIVRQGKQKEETFNNIFDGNSDKGYWKNGKDEQGNPTREWIKNPNYVPEKSGSGSNSKDPNDFDPTKPLSKVKEVITKINGIKTAKLDKKTGLYKVPDPNNLGFYDATKEEMEGLKEQFKAQYVSDANEMVKGMESAVEDIRTILDKSGGRTLENLPKALETFMKLNPDYDELDKDVLNSWFTLFLL